MKACPPPQSLLATAVAAAQKAGSYAFRNFVRRCELVARYPHDVKLVLDQECQRVAERVIRSRYPDHHILAEEDTGTRDSGLSEFQWIVDPIDGTVNFHHGLLYWTTSVAVRRHGIVIAGAVYAPALGELYEACIGSPARLNGKAIRVSATKRLADAMVLTGMDKNLTPDSPPLTLFRRVALKAQKARILGSASLDICHVARGVADGYVETGIYLWDIAAASLIVRQAGGRVTLRGYDPVTQRLTFLASNGHLHRALLSLLLQT